MPLRITIKQKVAFVVLAIVFANLFLTLHAFIPEWQAGAILIFTIMISTYLFVKYFSIKKSEETTEVLLLTEPSIDDGFQKVSANVHLAKEQTSQTNIHENEETAIPIVEAEFQDDSTYDATKAGEQLVNAEEVVVEEELKISENEPAATAEESDDIETEKAPEEVDPEPEQVEVEEEIDHEPKEADPEPDQVEVEEEVVPTPEEDVTEQTVAPKRLNRDLMDTLVQQLLWYKKQLSVDQYEQLIVDHAKEQLHDNDYYLFASMLRDHYIKTEQWDKLKSLLDRLKQRYNHKIIILEEITFFEGNFYRS